MSSEPRFHGTHGPVSSPEDLIPPIECGHCGAFFKAPDAAEGALVTCGECGAEVQIAGIGRKMRRSRRHGGMSSLFSSSERTDDRFWWWVFLLLFVVVAGAFIAESVSEGRLFTQEPIDGPAPGDHDYVERTK